MSVRCDAAEHLSELTFPVSTPRVMKAERTFWEKATAVHVFSKGGKIRGSRFSRHWYDLVQLDSAGHAEHALNGRALASQVARHKAMFFSEKTETGGPVDYAFAVSGHLQLVPDGPRLATLSEDYAQMIEDGLLLDDPSSFEVIIDRCRQLEERVNAAMRER